MWSEGLPAARLLTAQICNTGQREAYDLLYLGGATSASFCFHYGASGDTDTAPERPRRISQLGTARGRDLRSGWRRDW